jgi:group I intron endonuclease
MTTYHVYAFINTATQDAYVGCTSHIVSRARRHANALIKNEHQSKALQKAWDRYGSSCFQLVVLQVLEDISLHRARLIERTWIEKIGTYNEIRAVDGMPIWSETMRKNMSKHTKRRWADPELRKPLLAGLEQGNGFYKGMPPVKSPEQLIAHSEHMKELWADPKRRSKLEARRRARWKDPEAKARQAEKMRAYHAARRAAISSP